MKAKVSRGSGFAGLLRYAFDTNNHEHSLKNPEIVSSNMASKTPEELASEFGLARRLRRDIKKPVFHTALALPAGEKLTKEKWDAVVRAYMVEMGFDLNNHQFVAVIHRDTDFEHVHIAANRIGLDSKIWLGQWEAKQAIAATQKLEQVFGLKLTKGLDDEPRLVKAMTDGEYQEKARTGKDPVRLELAAIVRRVRDRSKSFRELVDGLAKQGVMLSPNGQTGTVSGASFKYKDAVISGSKAGKEFAWKALSAAVKFDPVADADLVRRLRSARDEDIEEVKDAAAAARDIVTHEALVDAGLADLFGTRSTIPMTRFEQVMTDLHREAPTFAEHVGAELRAQLQELGPDGDGAMRFTVKSVLERERQMIDGARLLAGDSHHDLSEREVADAIYAKELEASKKAGRIVRMTDEQKDAVRHAFKGGFTVMQGSAGAGKSFAMECVRLGYEERGYQVLGAAIAMRAAKNLEDEAGIRSYTVARLLTEINGKRIQLDKRSVIVVDEAGQVGVGYLAELVRHCEKSGAKLVFTGEDKQLDAIQHGGALRFLSRPEIIGTARIQAIQRQNEAWARQAVMDFRDGKMEEGLAAFERHGLVHWQGGGLEATQDALIKAWRDYELAYPDKSALILAHSNVSARALGAQVRQIRQAEGRVTGPDYVLRATHGGKGYALTLAQGDRVRFGSNDEEGIGAINGTLGTVTSIRRFMGSNGQPDFELVVATDDRGELSFRASDYCDEAGRLHMSQAYAMTIYSAQGVSVPGDVFSLQTPGMDRALTYVAHSRAKDNSHVFIDQDAYAQAAGSTEPDAMRAELVKTMERESGDRLASEILAENDPAYIAREYGTEVDAELRAARDAAMATGDDEEIVKPIETYEELLAHTQGELFGMEAVITSDRFEEVMIELAEAYTDADNDWVTRVEAALRPQLLALGVDEAGQQLFSTQAIIDRETQMIRDARELAMDTHHDLSTGALLAAIATKEGNDHTKTGKSFEMSAEQIAGVEHSLKGGFASLQGSAGAGKSTAMDAVRIAYEDKGYRVLGAAVSKRAAQNLESEAGIQSLTVAKLLKDIDRGKLQLDERTCLVVDEAGQVGSGYMAALARNCKASGAKLVFAGEDRQLDAIMHGGVLRFLSRDDVIGTARIQTIFRQREEWARTAVEDYRDGRMSKGLAAFEDKGLVHWVRGGLDETHERLIKHWHAYEQANPDKASLILAHSNASARALGERVRATRREEGKVQGEDYKLRGVHGDRAYELTLAQGDRIRFTLNSEQNVGVINGTLGTILSIRPMEGADGKTDYVMKVRADDRGEVTFKASEYCDDAGRVHLGQAYAMTVYSSQGVTVDGNVFVLQTAGMDRANTYVACSRAKDNTHIFIDRDAAASMARSDSDEVLRARLVQSMSREDSKKLATEILAANDGEYIKRVFGELTPNEARQHEFAQRREKRSQAQGVRDRLSLEAATQKCAVAMDPAAVALRERFAREEREAYIAKHGQAIVRPPEVPRPEIARPQAVPQQRQGSTKQKGPRAR